MNITITNKDLFFMHKELKTSFNFFKNIIPILTYQFFKNENILIVLQTNLLFVLKYLKLNINYQYRLLSCISGVDLLKKVYRFCLVYELLSLVFNARIRIKIFLDETVLVKSSTSLFINANWWEREIWDLYGIYFDQHPDLRRILTDYGFEGHPLRKDFPLSGYIEVKYDFLKKRVVLEPIKFSQEFRVFNFETPW